MPRFIISFVLIYTAALSVESVERFGLYQVGYWGSAGSEISHCSCVEPPCSSDAGGALLDILNVCIVFLGDFYFTRGFARGMRLQLRRVEASVEVASEIAAALARYDVEQAETAIATEQADLPPRLAKALHRLVTNLSIYKPYLPQSCLTTDSLISEGSPHFLASSGNPPNPIEVRPMPEVSLFGATPPAAELSPSCCPLPEVPPSRKPRTRRVSLACSNVVNYMRVYNDPLEDRHTEWMARDVAFWCEAVSDQGGMVDLIGGDRRYASFNARQACGDHASFAVSVLSEREGEGNRS
eukprot:Hpha_TRINITY_DN16666_c0_g1::TRINITY_DN16666_c0_g1_i1::g.178512::m.178512